MWFGRDDGLDRVRPGLFQSGSVGVDGRMIKSHSVCDYVKI